MSLRNLRRIEPFITGISQYAKVIEVFVQVKPEILGLIWVCPEIDRYRDILPDLVNVLGASKIYALGSLLHFKDCAQSESLL